MTSSNDLRARISSLLSKHDAINDVYRRAEDALEEEMDGIDWTHARPEDAKDAKDYCEHMHQSVRQAMLILLYSCLEAGMDLIGNEFITNYESKIRKTKKGEGSFRTRLRVFENSRIAFDSARPNCDIAEALRLIRNCLVHAAGRVARSTEHQKLEDAIEKVQEEGRKINCQHIDVKSGHLHLYDGILALANSTSHGLIWRLYDAAMRDGENRPTACGAR